MLCWLATWVGTHVERTPPDSTQSESSYRKRLRCVQALAVQSIVVLVFWLAWSRIPSPMGGVHLNEAKGLEKSFVIWVI